MKNLHRVECEQEIIGMLLNGNIPMYEKEDVITEISEFLKPSYFYDKKHQLIYENILKINDRGLNPDATLVLTALESNGLDNQTGGHAYIYELEKNSTNSIVNFLEYSRQIYQSYRNRTGFKKIANLLNEVDDIDSFQLQAESIYSSLEDDYQETGFTTKEDAIEQSIDAYKQSSQGVTSCFSTGFHNLDQIITGFQKGCLYVLGARPSMGKSAIAVNFIERMIKNTNIDSLVFSLEMTEKQLADRLIASMCDVDLRDLQNGEYDEIDDRELMRKVYDIVEKQTRMDIDKRSSGVTPEYIRLRVKQHKKNYPNLGFIMIDYLQLLSSEGGRNSFSNSRVLELAAMTRKLKALAMELDIPILLLSQLSREVEKRADKRPVNSDLRDSGAIEQDADVILLLHREAYYDKNAIPNAAELIVGKNRNGTTGTAHLTWNGNRCRFTDSGDSVI